MGDTSSGAVGFEPAVSENGPQYAVRAVDRVVGLLDTLKRAPNGASLGALAEATGMPKSSVFRYLATLEARGYVDKDPVTGDYSIGVALPSSRQHFDVLASRVRPTLERLRDRFGETMNFGVLDGDRILYVDIVESHRAMRLAAKRGDRDYLHSTALGKAIAAELPEADLRRLLASAGMPTLTDRTITRAGDFLDLLATVREDGFAMDDEENEQGARCIAVALPRLLVPAGMSLSAPAVRLPREEAGKVAQTLRTEAKRLASRLGPQPSQLGPDGR